MTAEPTAAVRGSLTAPPDATGRFGEFGGRFVPETLVPACLELEAAFEDIGGQDLKNVAEPV